MFTNLLVTGDKFDKDYYEGAMIVANKGDLKPWQTVLSVGSSVRDVKAGDKVMVNFDNYAVKKYDKNSIQNDLDNNPVTRYKLPWVTLEKDGETDDCLLLDNRDIVYVFEGEERDEPQITIPKKKIIV